MKLGCTSGFLPLPSFTAARAASSSYALVANNSFFRLRNKLTNPQMTNS